MGSKSRFLEEWLDESLHPNFVGWLAEVRDDISSAYCNVCHKKFKLSNMGIGAVTSHESRAAHIKKMKLKSKQPRLSFRLTDTKSNPSTTSTTCNSPLASSSGSDVQVVTPQAGNSQAISMPVLQQKDLQSYTVHDDDVTSAEIIWALQIVTSKMSLNSADKSSMAFKRMFPDSKIAQSFKMGRSKASYVINFGLAPFFKDNLLENIKTCNDYVVCFDESLNKVVQRGQMDVILRFWDCSQERVVTRYWNSVFLGRSTAEHLLEAFVRALDFPLNNLLQVSMDGPNVNLCFLKKLSERMSDNDPEGKLLLDIGVCGLHTVNGAVKTGHAATGWEIFHVLRSMYNIFKNSPARRAKYSEISGSSAFPKKFTSVRWLENGTCVDQAIKIWDYVGQYIKGDPLPDNKNYQCLAEAHKDQLMKTKLAAFRCVITECEPFLRRFQSQKPLAPFLYTALQELIGSLLRRILKQEKIREIESISKLLNLDLSCTDNLIPVKNVDVGFGAKRFLKEIRCSDSDRYKFKEEFRKFLIAIIEKMKMKSPLKSQLARGLTSLDPKIILLQSNLGLQRINIVLEHMLSARRLTEGCAEIAKKQYAQLVTDAQLGFKEVFLEFIESSENKGLDEFYYSLIGNNKNFHELWTVMKIIFIMSHGNASVESGFSINKNILVENLTEDSIVSQRLVYDSVNFLGGPNKINICRKLLTSVKSSRKRYQMCLDKKKEMMTEENKRKNEQRKIERELKNLEERRKIMELERMKEDNELNLKRKCLEMKKNGY